MMLKKGCKKIKKDYQAKKLKNPFFHQKQTGKTGFLKKWLFLLAFLFLAILIWFFLAAPVWSIKNVKITGLTRINNDELKKIIDLRMAESRWLVFREGNFFLFQKDILREEILSQYNFSDLKIKKTMPNSLEFIVSERPYAFILQEGSSYFYTSRDGYIIKEVAVTEEDLKKYFILENNNESIISNEKNKLNLKDTYLNFIFNFQEKISNYPDLTIEKYIIDQELNSLKVKFENGPLAFFNINNDAEEQITYLAIVKKEKMKDNFNSINYIDLRYGERIFIN